MNIQVKLEQSSQPELTGGEYTITTSEIYIDEDLDDRTQRMLIIHSVIEVYNRNWTHDKVEELTNYVQDALDQLEEIKGGTEISVYKTTITNSYDQARHNLLRD